MKLDISRFAESLEDVSDSDRMRIVQIPLAELVPDERNFYRISNVDELAASIELVGLEQPLLVSRRDDGRYGILSGHRRFAALSQLAEQGKKQFETAPCIEAPEDADPLELELRLLLGNANSRQLVPIELSRQAKRLEQLLRQVAAQTGDKVAGRKRDLIAKMLGVSPTKLAELDVIRTRLREPFAGQFARNELTQSAAYNLARLPGNVQDDLAEALGSRGKPVEGVAAERLLRQRKGLYAQAQRPCMATGCSCGNLLGFLRGVARPLHGWESCDGGRCCCDCPHRKDCSGVCAVAKKQNAEDKTREQARKQDAAAETAKQRKAYAESNARLAGRLVRAADAAGVSDETVIAGMQLRALRQWSKGDVPEARCYAADTVTPCATYHVLGAAKTLHCSTDYILGLTEELRPAPTPEEGQLYLMAWMPAGTTPAHSCAVVMEFDLGSPAPERRLGFFSAADGAFKINDDIIARQPTRWIELPE